MNVALEIPDFVALQLPSAVTERNARLLLELAVALYAKGTISLGQGAEMAAMSRMDFGFELGERSIPRHYGAPELTEDLAYEGGQ